MSSDGKPLEVESTPAPGDIEFLDDRLYEYNVDATGIRDGELLAIFVRDAGGEIEAGVSGWTWGDCSRIDKLWVRADRRAGGVGRRLVTAFEHEAARRGCRLVTLSSHSFQAPGFYQKLGYELWAVLDGYPSPHHECYLKKRL
jgi:GNAT superfamily N-acetyltransferase